MLYPELRAVLLRTDTSTIDFLNKDPLSSMLYHYYGYNRWDSRGAAAQHCIINALVVNSIPTSKKKKHTDEFCQF